MSETFGAERREVLGAVQRIVAMGLVAGASGNVSRRIARPDGDLFAVTASSVPYHRFTLDDVVVVDGAVDAVFGEAIPSTESLAHMAVYRARPDAGAVIHTHSPYASAFAAAGRPVPVILDEQVILLGGAVQVAEYAPASSEELASRAVEALGERAAVLLRHHGVLGAGRDLEEAVAAVELVERVAKVALLAATIGPVPELPPDVVEREARLYRMLKGFDHGAGA